MYFGHGTPSPLSTAAATKLAAVSAHVEADLHAEVAAATAVMV
jgi:hypothetical protein